MALPGTMNRVARPLDRPVASATPAPPGRPVALVALALTLVGVVVGAAVVNRARTPRGEIVIPADTAAAGAVAEPEPEPQPVATAASAVAAQPPAVFVPEAVAKPLPGRTTALRGLIENVESVTVNGKAAVVEPGAFTAPVESDAMKATVVATGIDGSQTSVVVALGADRVATNPAAETVAVHVGLEDMADPARWMPILAMARDGRINAVQIDIKDETGRIGYASQVPLAVSIGAPEPSYDPIAVIQQLHDLKIKVVGRIVCFLDPRLGSWAWENGRQDLVVQDVNGQPLANDYGSAAFSNVGQPEVRQYLWDLTSEAIGVGFDEILYDYVRRPEGNPTGMKFPGLSSSIPVAVAQFVRDSSTLIDTSDARFGISVFGISATRPDEIGQDIALLAPHVDYVAPMLYPALWGDGEYGVERPWKTPGLIVNHALVDFHRVIAGSGAEIIPWLQDFDAGRFEYGEAQVREQIDAARWQGTNGYFIWNPNSAYDAEALDEVFPRAPGVSGEG